ncbi:MAG: DUF6391 domain-containing protein [Anaerolineae bacterium]
MKGLLRTMAGAVERIRRNHALEHATIHMLAPMAGGAHLAGCTLGSGFLIMGPVPTQIVEIATSRALQGLTADPGLAVHPRCGTNLAVAGLLAGALLSVAESSRPRGLRAWLWRGLALGIAALLARPAGLWAQRHLTTSGHVEGMGIAGIRRLRWGRWTLHHVVTRYTG